MVAVAGSSVKSTPAWMLPSKVLAKSEYAFHLMLEGIFNPDLEENEEVWKMAGPATMCSFHVVAG